MEGIRGVALLASVRAAENKRPCTGSLGERQVHAARAGRSARLRGFLLRRVCRRESVGADAAWRRHADRRRTGGAPRRPRPWPRARYQLLHPRSGRQSAGVHHLPMSSPGKSAIAQSWEGLLPDMLGIELLELASERVTARMLVRPELCTIGGVMHGGSARAFADTVGGIATLLNLPPEARTTTIESKTNFLAAALSGTYVTGECTPIHRGRTTMVWQTRVTLEGGKLVAL